MERMVEKGKHGYYILSDRGTFGVEVDQYGEIEKTRFTGTVVDRLGEYEKSGMEPYEVQSMNQMWSSDAKELQRMKKNYEEIITKYQELLYDLCVDDSGSQVVALDKIVQMAEGVKRGVCRTLPCKIGDMVWVIDTIHNRIRSQKVTSIHYWENNYEEENHGFVETSYISESGEYAKMKRKFSDFGKTWFASKEEAKKFYEGRK